MTRVALPSVVVFVLAAALTAQRTTWIVDSFFGPGVNFTDIGSAITAARAGDRIEVRGAGGFSGFTLSKGLDIEAVRQATVGPMLIQSVPATETATIRGFTVSVSWASPPYSSVTIQGCRGGVILDSLRVPIGLSGGIVVSASDSVLVVGCDVRPPAFPQIGSPAMDVTGSRVTIQRSTLEGSAGSDWQGPLGFATPGGSGLRSSNATIVAASVTFRGGRGGAGDPLIANRCPSAGGNAVEGDRGVLMDGSMLVGGAGGDASPGCGPGRDGLAATGPFRITSDGGQTGGMAGGATLIAPLPAIRSPGTLFLGTPVTLMLAGQPGALFVVLFDDRHANLPVAGLDLPLLLSVGFITASVEQIGGTGRTPYTFTLPADPQLRDRFLFLQAVALQPSAPVLALTNLGDLRLR